MTLLDSVIQLTTIARPLAAGPGALLLVILLTPLVMRLAHRRGWVAEPTEDRWHERPTALMGGIAIYAAVTLAWLTLLPGRFPWYLWSGASLLFAVGLVDDLRHVSPPTKLLAQVAAAALVLAGGHELAPGWPAWLSAGLTLVWLIGITNAVNLLDNMDGLAAGIAAIAALTLGGFEALSGGVASAGTSLAVGAAAAGFLVYNFKPARIFMGDCGSLFLGFSVAGLALGLPGRGVPGTLAAVLVPVAIMAVPILDTTLVTIRRVLAGRSVAQGGRDHSSHRLALLGLSERRAVLTLYGVSVFFSACAFLLRSWNPYAALALLTFAGVGLVTFGVFLGGVEVAEDGRSGADGEMPRETEPAVTFSPDGVGRPPGAGPDLRGALHRFSGLLTGVADVLLIAASFVLAHYLRFEGEFGGARGAMVSALPLVIVVKVGCLHLFGLYRAVPRYAGSHDIVRVLKASTLASGLIVIALVLGVRFEGYSRAVFIIDWLLATVALVTVRGALRGLRGYFSARRNDGRRVLLYGAGDAGFLALREIRQNPDLGLNAVGFVDDDPGKQGRVVHGLPVLGGRRTLESIARRCDAEQVIVTITGLERSARETVAGECDRLGLACRVMRIDFEPANGAAGRVALDAEIRSSPDLRSP